MYHAFTARYNTFYNGKMAYDKAVKAQITGHKDNYLELLPLMVTSSRSTQKIESSSYDRAIEKSQKAIKGHSIKRRPKRPAGKKLTPKQRLFYSQKEFNPFLWQAWFLMANSQYRKGEFTEAAGTYIYISRLYENNPKIVAQARIGLALCYTEMDWLYEAEDLMQRIKRDTIPTELKKHYSQAMGNLLLKQERHNEAIGYIAEGIGRDGISSLEKAREYYLLGQLYAMTGDNKAAYKSFGKAISQSPPYELEFNARIRQTETASDENHKKILRKLRKMAKSPKNKEYLSQIYYAIGNIHMSQKDTAEAIKAYETGVAEGATSGYGTGMLHLSLAKIYWEKSKFSKSKENYDKALPLLTEETPGYKDIKFRSEVLGDIVQYTDVIEKQSELLYWATLPDDKLFPIIDALIEEEKRKQELMEKEEKKMKRESGGSALDQASNAAGMAITDPNEKAQWYFYNPQIVAQGIKSFKQKWGDRELKDYWRFSHEISSLMTADTIASDTAMLDSTLAMDTIPADSSSLAGIPETEAADSLSTDPTTREYYIQQIPVTEEQKEKSHTALRDALFEAGIRFKDKANDKKLTLRHLEQVVTDYPEYERMAEVYFQLFLACSRWGENDKAGHYKALMIENYPDSTDTKLIQEPDFFDNAATRKHKEDSIYIKAYSHYTNKEYGLVEEENLYAATKYPNGKHRARFLFIDAMSKLYNDKQEEAMKSLEELVSKYSADSISRIAQSISTGIKEGRLLKSGISTSIWERKAGGSASGEGDSVPEFSTDRNGAYYFVLAFPNDSVDEKRLLFEISRYNFSRYMVRSFETTFERLPQVTLFEVKEFLNFDEAYLYRKRLYENGETARLLEGINAFIISKSNLELLLQYYSFEDYRRFYEKVFLAIPEVEIDGYTLDEPDYNDDEEESDGEENNSKRKKE